MLICPIINAAFDRQCDNGLELLQSRDASDNGNWNSFLFVNGRTEKFHREDDCAYTYITVPNHYIDKTQHCTNQASFLFQIDEERILSINMTNDLSFFYNASFLTHRQSYIRSPDEDKNNFYNISSYSNEKLFNHLRQSFKRLN